MNFKFFITIIFLFLIFPSATLSTAKYSDSKLLQVSKEKVRRDIFEKKVIAVKEYMEFSAICQEYSPNDIALNPEFIVKIAEEKNFDIPLLMAQAHLESCFGLSPRAKKTNSVFAVGLYDDGTNACIYKTQNESIESYINLMQSNYLINGKSINDLLKKGSFIDMHNRRYAKDINYEYKIQNLRNKIIKKYPELLN